MAERPAAGWTARPAPITVGVMRIACPSCAAEYEVPEAALATGPRLLRCARCGHRFTSAAPAPPTPAPPSEPPPAEPEPPAASPPPPPAPGPEASHEAATSGRRSDKVPHPPADGALPPEPAGATLAPADPPLRERLVDPPPAPPRGTLMLAWLLTVAVLGLAAWTFWRYRPEIAEAWPPAARLYRMLGL